MTNTISIKGIQALLSYNAETGDLVWVKRTSNRIKVGDVAGSPHGNGYTSVGIKGRNYFAHRLAFAIIKGRWPDNIDHINGIRSDNRWGNLREVTHAENHKNQKLRKNNKSGVQGVHWTSRERRWVATINSPDGQECLGHFVDKDMAAAARKEAEQRLGFHRLHGTAK